MKSLFENVLEIWLSQVTNQLPRNSRLEILMTFRPIRCPYFEFRLLELILELFSWIRNVGSNSRKCHHRRVTVEDPSNTEEGIGRIDSRRGIGSRSNLTFHGPKSRVGFKIQIGFSIQEYISNKRLMTMTSLNVGNALKINEINFWSKSSLFRKKITNLIKSPQKNWPFFQIASTSLSFS